MLQDEIKSANFTSDTWKTYIDTVAKDKENVEEILQQRLWRSYYGDRLSSTRGHIQMRYPQTISMRTQMGHPYFLEKTNGIIKVWKDGMVLHQGGMKVIHQVREILTVID